MSERLWLGTLAAVTFLLYLLTMCPTVYLGDAGELTVAGIQLGIPHPPGYPLSTMLSHLVIAMMPMGSLAFRTNLLDVLAALVAVLFLAKLVEALMSPQLPPARRWPIACAVALSFGMSRVFWSQAIITEVYAVMMLIFLAMMWRLWEAARQERLGPLLVVGCLYGLGFVQHPTLWLMGPVIAVWVVWLGVARWRTPWIVPVLLAVSLLPLALYVYFPLRSLANPDSDWGNPETLHRVLRHVMRKQYRAVGAGPRSLELFLGQLGLFWTYLREQLTAPLVMVACAGLLTIWKVLKSWAVGFTVLFLFSTLGGIFFLNYLPTVHQKELIGVFFLPGVALLTIGLGLAASTLMVRLQRVSSSAALVGMALCGTMPLWPAQQSWQENNHSRNTIAYHSAVDMLNAFPQRAILFTAGDFTAFPLAYLVVSESRRGRFPGAAGSGAGSLPKIHSAAVPPGSRAARLYHPGG